jgi:hypothetical protein
LRRQADYFSFAACNVLQFIREEERLQKQHSADNCTNWSCRRNTVRLLYYLFLYFESEISPLVSHFRTIKLVCSNNTLSPHSAGTSPSLKRVNGYHSSYFVLGKEGMLATKLNDIIKVHHITSHAGTAGEQRYSSTHSLTLTLIGVGWSTLRPDRFIPEKRPGVHCTGGSVGPRKLPGRLRKISPSPEFKSRAIQSVMSHNTNYTILFNKS